MKRAIKYFTLFMALLFLPYLPAAHGEKSNGIIRVLLTKLNLTDRVEISLDGSYTLNNIAFQRGSDLIVSCKDDRLMVHYEGMAMDAGTSLTLIRHPISDEKENGLRFNGAYELHPGDLYLSIQNGQLRPVLHAPVEEYLLGVVPYEMSDSFPVEALKAQAVAARTYALKRIGAHDDYDVVDNTNDQAYYGVKKEHTNAAIAVSETAGVCGFYKGKMADCFYSASNGGQTELVSHVWGEGDYGYLTMFDDPYDVENKESVVKSASIPKTISDHSQLKGLENELLGLLSETLESMGYDGSHQHIRIVGIENAELSLPLYTDSPSKIMTLLKLSLLVEGRRLIEESAEEEISIFALPTADPVIQKESWSPMQRLPQPITIALDIFPSVERILDLSINSGSNELFTIRETDNSFMIESRRYGHGVGMSQRGAQCMAGSYDWSYQQILRFYYPGMDLKTVQYTYTFPKPISQSFLATPGPAATPTPRPTAMPLLSTPGPNQFVVIVDNIGVNSYLNLRSEPNTQSSVLRQLYYGQQLIVLEDLGEWLKVQINDLTGYVMRSFVNDLPT